MSTFPGTITAIVTPFVDGRIDFERLDALVERQIAGGVDGIVPCGTTGESPTLSKDEHAAVVERVVAAARRRCRVIAGTGSNSTAETIRMSQHAEKAGADGVLVVNPYYNRPTQRGLFEHFSAVARSMDLPIMLYNIPGRCAVELSVATIAKLRTACPNIVSVKHATGRVDDAAELMSVSDIEVVSGDDPITLPLMSIGAVGVVSVMSNLVPRAVKSLTDAALNGDMAAARSAHRKLYPLMRGLLSLEINPLPIKTSLALRGLCAESFRLPMCTLEPEKRAALESLLQAHESILEP